VQTVRSPCSGGSPAFGTPGRTAHRKKATLASGPRREYYVPCEAEPINFAGSGWITAGTWSSTRGLIGSAAASCGFHHPSSHDARACAACIPCPTFRASAHTSCWCPRSWLGSAASGSRRKWLASRSASPSSRRCSSIALPALRRAPHRPVPGPRLFLRKPIACSAKKGVRRLGQVETKEEGKKEKVKGLAG